MAKRMRFRGVVFIYLFSCLQSVWGQTQAPPPPQDAAPPPIAAPSSERKPKVATRAKTQTEEEAPLPVLPPDPIPALNFYSVPSAKTDARFPALVMEMPKPQLPVAEIQQQQAQVDNPSFELKGKDREGRPVTLVTPEGEVIDDLQFSFKIKVGDKFERVNDQVLKDGLRRAIELAWQGTPNGEITVDEDGELRYAGKVFTMVFAFKNTGMTKPLPFPPASQPLLAAQFRDFIIGVELAPKVADFHTVTLNVPGENEKLPVAPKDMPLYFGLLMDGQPMTAATQAKPIYQKVARAISGEDEQDLSTDALGNITWTQSATQVHRLKLVLVTLGPKDPVELVPDAIAKNLQLQLRKQVKYTLIVRKAEEQARRQNIAQGEAWYDEAAKVLASNATTNREKRRAELAKATENFEKAETVLKKYVRAEPSALEKVRSLNQVKRELAKALDSATFPVSLALAEKCAANWALQQDARDLWTVRYSPTGGAPLIVAQLARKPTWWRCDESNFAVYGAWKELNPASDRFPLQTQFALNPKSSTLTRESLQGDDKDVLLAFHGPQLFLAREFSSEFPAEDAEFTNIGPRNPGIRVRAKGLTNIAYEVPYTGTTFRTRILPSNGEALKGYSFFLLDGNYTEVVSDTEAGEVNLLRARGVELANATRVPDGLAFESTGVLISDRVNQEAFGEKGLDQFTGKSTVYVLTGNKLLPIITEKGNLRYGALRYNEATHALNLSIEGNRARYQEAMLDGTGIQTLLSVPANCAANHKFVLGNDEKLGETVSMTDIGRNTVVAKFKDLSHLACSTTARSFIATRMDFITLRPRWAPEPQSNNVTLEELNAGDEPKMVVIKEDTVVNAFRFPAGLKPRNLTEFSDEGFELEFGAKFRIVAKISSSGKWVSPVWNGSLKNDDFSLLRSTSETSPSVLFYKGELLALAEKLAGASTKDKFAVIVAEDIEIDQAMGKNELVESPLSAMKKDTEKGGILRAYTFRGPVAIAYEESPTASEGGSILAVKWLKTDGKLPLRQISFTNNDDYSLVVDLENKVVAPQKPLPKEERTMEWASLK